MVYFFVNVDVVLSKYDVHYFYRLSKQLSWKQIEFLTWFKAQPSHESVSVVNRCRNSDKSNIVTGRYHEHFCYH